jgi:hypothetical protein
VVDHGRRGHGAARQHGHGAGLRRPCGAARRARGHQLGDPLAHRLAARAGGGEPGRERERHHGGRGHADGRPRAVHELADGVAREPQVARHLVLPLALDRGPQQRVALAIRQRGDGGQRPVHERPPLDLLLWARGRRQRVDELVEVLAGHAQLVERGVAHDPVQPRPQLADLVAAPERRPGRYEGELERVLGPGLGQDPPTRPQQRAAVALDDRLERAVVADARQRDQPRV